MYNFSVDSIDNSYVNDLIDHTMSIISNLPNDFIEKYLVSDDTETDDVQQIIQVISQYEKQSIYGSI